MVTFVETKLFTKLVHEYLSHDEYSALQQSLVANPEAGASSPARGESESCAGELRGAANEAEFALSTTCGCGKDRFGC
jgi:hypothetical protein